MWCGMGKANPILDREYLLSLSGLNRKKIPNTGKILAYMIQVCRRRIFDSRES
jgi:hypothetical protein